MNTAVHWKLTRTNALSAVLTHCSTAGSVHAKSSADYFLIGRQTICTFIPLLFLIQLLLTDLLFLLCLELLHPKEQIVNPTV